MTVTHLLFHSLIDISVKEICVQCTQSPHSLIQRFLLAVYWQRRSEGVDEELGLRHKDPSGKVSIPCPSAPGFAM